MANEKREKIKPVLLKNKNKCFSFIGQKKERKNSENLIVKDKTVEFPRLQSRSRKAEIGKLFFYNNFLNDYDDGVVRVDK